MIGHVVHVVVERGMYMFRPWEEEGGYYEFHMTGIDGIPRKFFLLPTKQKVSLGIHQIKPPKPLGLPTKIQKSLDQESTPN